MPINPTICAKCGKSAAAAIELPVVGLLGYCMKHLEEYDPEAAKLAQERDDDLEHEEDGD